MKMNHHENGALQKLEEYFVNAEPDWPEYVPLTQKATYLLAWLWIEGFKIVPLEATDEY
jgi:hypothetical protein